MTKKSEKLKKAFADKNVEGKKQNLYLSQGYHPDVKVELSGEEFTQLLRGSYSCVFKRIGSPFEEDLKNIHGYLLNMNKPVEKVVLTGSQFEDLRMALVQARSVRMEAVFQNGQELENTVAYSRRNSDIDGLFGLVDKIHRRNVDNGVTTPLEQLREELKKEEAPVEE